MLLRKTIVTHARSTQVQCFLTIFEIYVVTPLSPPTSIDQELFFTNLSKVTRRQNPSSLDRLILESFVNYHVNNSPLLSSTEILTETVTLIFLRKIFLPSPTHATVLLKFFLFHFGVLWNILFDFYDSRASFFILFLIWLQFVPVFASDIKVRKFAFKIFITALRLWLDWENDFIHVVPTQWYNSRELYFCLRNWYIIIKASL